MKLPRRTFLRLAASAAALPTAARIANAQVFPNRAVRLIVPFAPAAGADLVFRLLANRLSEIWQQTVVIENRTGSGGNLGMQAAIQSPPDGYTLFAGTSFLATNRFMYPSLGYDPVADLAPVSLVGIYTNVMVVPNSSPAKSVKEFIDYAKINRDNVTYASGGIGTSLHLSGELLKQLTHIEMVHVPYRGGTPAAINDLIGGRIDTVFTTLPGGLPLVQSGALRALAVTTAKRSAFAPDIPTIAESGVPGFEVEPWYGLFMPAKTPVDIVAMVHDAAVMALAHPPVIDRLKELGVEVVTSTPAGLAAYLKAEIDKWGPVIKAAGIKGE